MAKSTRTVTELTDDIDGGPAVDTVRFYDIGGQAYDIDLNDDNAVNLGAAVVDCSALLRPYVTAARKVSPGGKRTAAAKPSRDGAAVRAWAGEHGYTVGARGRIPGDVIAAYEAAQA